MQAGWLTISISTAPKEWITSPLTFPWEVEEKASKVGHQRSRGDELAPPSSIPPLIKWYHRKYR